jgi:hypothetical protein
MAVHTIDLLDHNTLRIVPTVQEVIRLCLLTGTNILEYLSSILTLDRFEDVQTINNYIMLLRSCLSDLGKVLPIQPGRPPFINIFYIHVEQHAFRDFSNLKQVFTMKTLGSVNHTVLIEVLYKLIETSLRWIEIHVYAPPTANIEECRYKNDRITKDLFVIFSKLLLTTKPTLATCKMKVEFVTQNY